MNYTIDELSIYAYIAVALACAFGLGLTVGIILRLPATKAFVSHRLARKSKRRKPTINEQLAAWVVKR